MSMKNIDQMIEESRIVFLHERMDMSYIGETIHRILMWNAEDQEKEIHLYISSHMGLFTNAVAIFDVLSKIENPVSAVAIGSIGAFGLLFLASADKGKRYALPHTRLSFNQPTGALIVGENQQTEIEIEARETAAQRKIFEEILADSFGLDLADVHQLVEDDEVLDAYKAKELGLIDQILEK